MDAPAEIDDAEAAADRAAAAGDFDAAHNLLEGILARAPERLETWLKLGAIRRAVGDVDGALHAVSGALRVNPLHFVALLSRARLLEIAGKQHDAGRVYSQALAQLPDKGAVADELLPMIRRAETLRDSYRSEIAATWSGVIATVPALGARERARMSRFTSNATRETRVYHSKPTHYHYPGLVELEFHDRETFHWIEMLEAATADIQRECLALLSARDGLAEPYVQYAADAPVRQWSTLNHSMDWTAFHLLKCGIRVEENANRCPRTMAVLANIPQPHIAGRSPNAMFSLLRPGTRIPPHTGVSNTRLVCHLPVLVPEKCWFRVGAQTRLWHTGEAIVFDDTIEHEAANESEEVRVVLIIDVWHPGLNDAERTGVQRIMEAEQESDGGAL